MSKARQQQFGGQQALRLPIGSEGIATSREILGCRSTRIDTETGERTDAPSLEYNGLDLTARNTDIGIYNAKLDAIQNKHTAINNVRILPEGETTSTQQALDSILDASATRPYVVLQPPSKAGDSFTPKSNCYVVNLMYLNGITAAIEARITNNVAITGGTMSGVAISTGSIAASTTIAVGATPIHDCVYHDQITQDQTNATGTSTVNLGSSTANQILAQTFTPGASKQMTHCEFVIARVGTLTDGVYVAIYNTTAGVPSGSSRVKSGILQARDIQDGVVNSFYFPRYAPSSDTGNWLLSTNTYAIALIRTGAVDASNYYQVYYGTANPYANGSGYSWNGTVWNNLGGVTTNDFRFTTYYGETTQTNIILDQLDPSNGILPIQNLGTGTLTSGAVLAVPASGNVPVWSTSLTIAGLTLNGVVITSTGTEINYTDGVTSAIQTQLDARVLYTGATANVDLGAYNLTANIVISDSFRVGNPANAYYSTLTSQANTTNKIATLPNYTGIVLLDQQVILASENASTNPYTISANVTQVYGTYAGTATVNIPANAPANKVYIISCGSGSTVVLTPPGGETIDGLATLWLYPNDAAIIIKTGSDWRVASFRGEIKTIAKGGTGATTAAGARTNLGLVIGTDVLAYSASTGTGDIVRATSPTLVTPLLGTPTSGTLTNCTGYPGDSSLVTLGTITAPLLISGASAPYMRITDTTDSTYAELVYSDVGNTMTLRSQVDVAAASSTCGNTVQDRASTATKGYSLLNRNGTVTTAGNLTSFDCWLTASNTIKIKVFRDGGANWNYIGESELFNATGGASENFILATPIAVLVGDYIGIFVGAGGAGEIESTATGGADSYKLGDVTTNESKTTYWANATSIWSVLAYITGNTTQEVVNAVKVANSGVDGKYGKFTFGHNSTSLIGLYGVAPVAQAAALTAALTTLTYPNAASDYAIQALVQNTGFGFVNQAEGDTVLQTVIRHGVQLAEIKTALTNIGITL